MRPKSYRGTWTIDLLIPQHADIRVGCGREKLVIVLREA